ncbi:hypothetical protein LXL04_001133 [Taraxacum kok-saghyz]
MNIEQQVNQIPIRNSPDLNQLLKNSNTNTDTNENQFSDTWFELDYEKSMNTGNLFYSGSTKNPVSPPLNTTTPILQPTNPQTTINAELPNIHQTNTTTPENTNHIPNQSYRSYANVTSVAARRSKAKLQYYPPSTNENDNGPVVIPIQLCETANEKHANTLFGYFIGANPSFNTVREHVKTKWASCGITDIKRNGKGFYLFKFSNEQGLMNVLQSDHWMIKEVPIFIQRWQPGTCLTKAKHDKVPVWVKIHDIPLEAWSVEGIGRIASRIGIPLDMDTYTEEMCVDGKGRCAYARVLIEISANKPWEEYIEVQTWELESKTGVNHSLQLEYSWVPTRCDKCKVYDHSKSTCPLQAVEKPTIPNNTMNNPHHIFEANGEKEGFMVVTKRKRSNNKTKTRSRGPSKNKTFNTQTTSDTQQTQEPTMQDCRYIASELAKSVENTKKPTVNQEPPMNVGTSKKSFTGVNNETYDADIPTELNEETVLIENEEIANNMETEISTSNRFSTLIMDDEDEDQESTETEDIETEKTNQEVKHEVAMESATKTNVSQ